MVIQPAPFLVANVDGEQSPTFCAIPQVSTRPISLIIHSNVFMIRSLHRKMLVCCRTKFNITYAGMHRIIYDVLITYRRTKFSISWP